MQKESEEVPLRVRDGILGRGECLSAKRCEARRFGWVTHKSPLLLILRSSSKTIWLERKTGGIQGIQRALVILSNQQRTPDVLNSLTRAGISSKSC